MIDSTELFCKVDDFFKKFEPIYLKFIKQSQRIQRVRASKLSLSEIIFIAICYKCSQFNNFKAFFYSIPKNSFKYLPNYQRVIHLMNTHQLALHALHFALMKNTQTFYTWINSTTLPVCRNQRIQRHKSLSVIATRGKSSMGWFYGCKLHLAMNQFGEIVSTELSNGHVADIKMLSELTKNLKGSIYGDRGYINLKLKEDLKQRGIDLVTYHRKNMKLIQLTEFNQYYLRQRNKIETLFSLLKGRYHLVTSKARSIEGYLAGIYASLCAYQLCHENKPTIRMITESA